MSEVKISNPAPAVFRWITCLAGVIVMLIAPVYGVSCILEQHVEQGPQRSGNGRMSEGFELYGPAAVVFGIGFAGVGLTLGYGIGFRASRKILVQDDVTRPCRDRRVTRFGRPTRCLAVLAYAYGLRRRTARLVRAAGRRMDQR